MIRLKLTDVMRKKLKSKLVNLGVYQTDNIFNCIEGIIWKIRTGAPWRDLPKEFGPWKTVYNRFNQLSRMDVWGKLFLSVRHEMDLKWTFIDGTYIKAHQHSAGGIEDAETKTIGKSRGGLTTKIHMATDAHGNPQVFTLTSGSVHDVTAAPCLLTKIGKTDHVIGDKGYDSETLRQLIQERNAIPHIPLRKKSTRTNPLFDKELYKSRSLVENLFARLKHFRGFATRYDKLTRNYASVVSITCALVWLKL